MKSKQTTSTRVYKDTKKRINAVAKKTRMSSAQIVEGWMDSSRIKDGWIVPGQRRPKNEKMRT